MDEKGRTFEAHGHYTASTNGKIHLNKHPSIGGTYTGIEPMGLFWSMVQSPGQKKGIRYVKLDVTQPSNVELSLYPGYLGINELQDSKPMTTTRILRVFMDEHMERFEVKVGRVRGTLIKPKGQLTNNVLNKNMIHVGLIDNAFDGVCSGPFPGIIDMYGALGGLLEMRASLLANYGYAVLALGYCRYKDLPENFLRIDLDYFEASTFFQECVMTGGIGTIGLSKGAELAVTMAVYFPDKVKAVVSINGAHMHTGSAMKFRGQTLPYTGYDNSKLVIIDGNACSLELLDDPVDEAVFDFSRVKAEMLYIAVGDDLLCKTPFYAEEAIKRIRSLNKSNYRYLYYPGAGHLVQPPNTPLSDLAPHWFENINVMCGGRPKPHARAQEDSWKHILQFFQSNLKSSSKL
ncbi:acyl-coenzyme A thioesterase 2, mitochondrial-like [Saccoglossus kowalevskii]